jgi:hypothetical protein
VLIDSSRIEGEALDLTFPLSRHMLVHLKRDVGNVTKRRWYSVVCLLDLEQGSLECLKLEIHVR